MNELLIASLRRAIEAAPDDVPLRLHLGGLLLESGQPGEAVSLAGAVLQLDPANPGARELMTRALSPAHPPAEEGHPPQAPTSDAGTGPGAPASAPPAESASDAPAGTSPAPDRDAPSAPSSAGSADTPAGTGFDWSAAENQLGDVVKPMFVDGEPTSGETPASDGKATPRATPPPADRDAAPPPDRSQSVSGTADEEPAPEDFEVERPSITLADVGGMASVKARLDAAFLAPLRNPELRKLYAKSLGGGLLMYGPPGCGKTFIAKAVAGELGAKFLSVGVADILDRWLGNSEANLHSAFLRARREAPCVLFFDEFDTLGQRRSQSRGTGMRSVINQMLTELDGVDGGNDGVFVLAATNQPWDIDPALRRPGRLDRTVLVLPPDEPAREAIFRTHLKNRPVEGIDLARLAKRSDKLSGADIAYACEVASERALLDSAASGVARYITMADVEGALREVRPSVGPWLDSARNVVLFGDDDGTYAELGAYLKKMRRI